MKLTNHIIVYSILINVLVVGFLACSNDSAPEEVIKPEEKEKILTTNTSNIEFEYVSSSYNLTISTNVDSWAISSSVTSWIQLSQTTGTSGNTVVKISISENPNISVRTAIVTVNANQVSGVKITVSQAGAPSTSGIYPDYNLNPIEADETGMNSSAKEIAAKIDLGWNVGNSLEATGSETAWGNPKVTKELIDLVKLNGFNAVRIPCSWNQYLSNAKTAEIKTDWLNRVKEVIQYCIDNEMYAILNIHWDGGWLENNVTDAKKEENNAKQKAFWEQIATYLRDFDEHLLFASANEPNVEDATQMAVLNSYHQTFIDAVRSTGGKNAYRTLVIQGPSTDIEKTNNLMTTLPADNVLDRIMIEIHYYTPWQFAGLTEDASWGKMTYYWGVDYHSNTDTERNATWGEETDLENYFKLMKDQFVDKGIPVVLGEFGAIRRSSLTGDALTLHLNSRAYYLKSVVKQAKANGLLPFYWDEGNIENHGFGIIDRSKNTVFDTQALEALIQGLN